MTARSIVGFSGSTASVAGVVRTRYSATTCRQFGGAVLAAAMDGSLALGAGTAGARAAATPCGTVVAGFAAVVAAEGDVLAAGAGTAATCSRSDGGLAASPIARPQANRTTAAA